MEITRVNLLDRIKESTLERWKGLRTILGAVNQGLVVLPNDDTPAAQLKGMAYWLSQNEDYTYIPKLFDDGGFIAHPEDIATSYVARQIGVDSHAQNVLYNMQVTSTKAVEAERLDFWADQLTNAEDINLQSTMRLISRILKEDGASELAPLKEHLATACAFFYLQTALEAAEKCTEATSLFNISENVNVMAQETAITYQLLAVNAYVNNIGAFEKFKDQLPEDHPIRAIVSQLNEILWINDPSIREALFKRSLEKAKASPTSSTVPVAAQLNAAATPGDPAP